MGKVVFHVEGMTCNHCRMAVEKTLKGLDGVEEVNVDLETGKVELVRSSDSAPGNQAIRDAVTQAGYTVTDM